MFLFSNDLGVDLGNSNVLIYADGKGLVVREPSVVAVDKNTGKILQVGAAARNMLGRTPGNVVAMKPLRDGIISDHEMTVRMLQEMFKTATKASWLTPKPRVVISVPSGVTEVEERSVINAAIEAGARRVFLIEEPLAAGLGAGLDIKGRLTFRHRRKGNRIPHPFPDQLRSKDFGSSCESHPKGWLFLLAEKGFEPILMQQPGGLLLPPVQKPVASLLFAKGEKAIESLIRSPQQAEKLEFGGESPLTMRYGLQVDILHPLGPSTGTA